MTFPRAAAALLFVGSAFVWTLAPASDRVGPSEPAGSSMGAASPEAIASSFARIIPQQSWEDFNAPYDGRVHFSRIRYESARGGFGRRRGGASWAHDYPRAERNFMQIINETTYIDALTDGSNIVALSDSALFQYPIAYIVEVGDWGPSEDDVAALGEFLMKGGFLIVDDTRDEWSYRNFAEHMSLALPGLNLVPLADDHEIFDSFFRINPLEVIPPYGPTNPLWFGIFEENDPDKRLMVVFNFNNDIAEYWEYSDMGYYAIDIANEAYKLGVNYLVYALTH